jgi:hypothetical protein
MTTSINAVDPILDSRWRGVSTTPSRDAALSQKLGNKVFRPRIDRRIVISLLLDLF